jgi:hypothetical protein
MPARLATRLPVHGDGAPRRDPCARGPAERASEPPACIITLSLWPPTPGTRFGPCEVTAPLGTGGMGGVCRRGNPHD